MMTIWVFMFLIFHCVAQQIVPALLAHEKNVGNPGVRSRLSQKGINYIARTIVNLLATEVANTEVDPTLFWTTNEKISIASVKLLISKSTKVVQTSTKEPNRFFSNISNVRLTVKTELSVRGIPTTIISELSTPNVLVYLDGSVVRTKKGSPNFRIEHCKVQAMNKDVKVNLNEDSVNTTLKQEIMDLFTKESDQILNNLLCAQITFVLNDRINNRFELLPLKITLAKLSETFLINDFMEKLHAIRHQRSSTNSTSNVKRSKRAAIISSFNISRADNLYLDYIIVKDPHASAIGLEIDNSGEVSIMGKGNTPFGAVAIPFPRTLNEEFMLQMAVSDFVPNSLMFHGHNIGLFNTRIDPTTPYFGGIMRTTCNSRSGILFCLGDLFPTLKRLHPDHKLALFFDTVQAPVIQFRPPSNGGITFTLFGKIVVLLISNINPQSESKVAEFGIDVKAHMKLRISSTDVRPKITLDKINLTTLSPGILLQTELNDAVLLTREVLQRMVNDILANGIPIPIHPLFKLSKPKIKVLERALLLQTNFDLNENLLQHIISTNLSGNKTPIAHRI